MPYDVRRSGSNYVVVDDSGRVVGTHGTKQEALDHQSALYANVPEARKSDDFSSEPYPDRDAAHNVADYAYSAPDGIDNVDTINRLKEIINGSDPTEKQAPCWEGYVQRGMKPGKDGKPVPNCVPVEKAEFDDALAKGEKTYTPNAGMKAAARRALKWKEEGKATGAGTPVGWGRASDIVAGRSMSLSTVKRMYSFFSRHEVDKKGKDFYNTSNPSNGRIMWDAWGGDAGYSWSRKIVNQADAAKAWRESPFFN